MDCEGRAVSFSRTGTSVICSGLEQLFPAFPNVCSESGVFQAVQRRVLPITNGEKLLEVNNNVRARFESDRKTETQYSIYYKVTPMNKGCVACGCQLIPLSGSAQRKTIILLYPILRTLHSCEEPTQELLRIKNDISSCSGTFQRSVYLIFSTITALSYDRPIRVKHSTNWVTSKF